MESTWWLHTGATGGGPKLRMAGSCAGTNVAGKSSVSTRGYRISAGSSRAGSFTQTCSLAFSTSPASSSSYAIFEMGSSEIAP